MTNIKKLEELMDLLEKATSLSSEIYDDFMDERVQILYSRFHSVQDEIEEIEENKIK